MVLAVGTLFLDAPEAWADSADRPTFEERQHERAETRREESRAQAESHLGYDDVIFDPRSRYIDFYSLSQQIARLGALLDSLAETRGLETAAPFVPGPPGWTGGPGPALANVYGPDGPTEKSVRLLLEYRLLVAGNPRLAVGTVRETGNAIHAQVVTTDGSVVEEFAIDKTTGVWTPMR